MLISTEVFSTLETASGKDGRTDKGTKTPQHAGNPQP